MTDRVTYDTGIIGGGLAGLALSIQLAKQGFKVALFEKEAYPFHKVCGEYISLESWNFLESLGLPLSSMNLPIIKHLIVTSPNGNELRQDLPLGGFGISRYKIDGALKKIAEANAVMVFEHCKVNNVKFIDDRFYIQTGSGDFYARTCCGTYGKRSNLDIKWNRLFTREKPNKLNNYIAVKYHIRTNFDPGSIALHNFENGYCGISKIEDDKYCLCYLTTAANLKASDNTVASMEQHILQQNPHLQHIFNNSEIIYESPVTISQISFSKKTQVEDHVLLIGDAAGMITPLCGNGMSMALHGSKIAGGFLQQFLSGKISRADMESGYVKKWQATFSNRLRAGRWIQSMFGSKRTTNFFIAVMKKMPGLTGWLVKQTHGKPF